MTTLADRTITALRQTHDDVAGLVPTLSDDQLSLTSGAAEWTVAQALSHLGSGAEIALAGLRAALDDEAAPGQEFNQGVWDRRNSMSSRQQAEEFVQHDIALVEAAEALTPDQRESVQAKLGFLPGPIPLTSVLGMRLSEAALHSWDVRVALDAAATLDAASAAVLVEHYSDGLGFMLGFSGKADQLAQRAVVHAPEADVAVVIDDSVSLVAAVSSEATATFTGAPEALLRLLAGRLAAAYTPAMVEVTGSVTLDDMRRVFPGY